MPRVGIGAQAKALENLGVNFEHYRICEFDKYAVQSYNAVHGTNFEPSDITKITGDDLGIVETDKYDYIVTYSFPCQSLSAAGRREGMEKGSGTRSGLLWEVERLLTESKELPKVLLMENVCAVHGNKFGKSFNEWCNFLETLGYTNYYKDLNARDYGIPQNRDRCFMVSVLGNYNYNFPTKTDLKLKLKDLLEDQSIDNSKYNLSSSMIKYIIAENEKWTGNNGKSLVNKTIASTINTKEGSRRCDASNYICEELPSDYDLKQLKDFFIQHSFDMEAKGNGFRFEPHIKNNANLAKTILTSPGHRMDDNYIMYADSNNDKIKFESKNQKAIDQLGDLSKIRIRKLTPLECWRLMGFDDEDCLKAQRSGISNSQLYKQAGNSICVTVLEAIFKGMM